MPSPCESRLLISFSIFLLPVLLVASDNNNNQEPLTDRPITEQSSPGSNSPSSSDSTTSSSREPTPKMSNKTPKPSSDVCCSFVATRNSKSSAPRAPAKSRQPLLSSPYLQQPKNRRGDRRTVVVPHVIAPVAASLVPAATTASLDDAATRLFPTPKLSVFGSNNSSRSSNNNNHDIGTDEEEWHDSFQTLKQQQETTDWLHDDDDDDFNDGNLLEDSLPGVDRNDSSTKDKVQTGGEAKDDDWNTKIQSSRSMHHWIMYILMILFMSTLFLAPADFEALVDMDVVPPSQLKFWVSTTTRSLFSSMLGGDETLTAIKAGGANSSSSSSSAIIVNGNHFPLGNSPVITPIVLVDKGLMQSASQNSTL
jgi:hypothetical protein